MRICITSIHNQCFNFSFIISFVPNYDESQLEPSVLPAEFPNILVNGAGGIAVGMATSIPPHNLGEIVDATIAFINNKEIIPELLQGECNAKEIFRSVVYFLKNPSYAQKQVDACSHTLNQIRSKSSSTEEAAKILSEYLVV